MITFWVQPHSCSSKVFNKTKKLYWLRDYWQVDGLRRELIRHHGEKRINLHDMQRSETTPIPKDQLLDEREIHIEYQKSGKKVLQKDNWHTEEKIFSDKMGELWKRKTIYKIKDDYVIPEGIHSTLYSPHSTLQTLHFYTLHVTLRFRPSRLCTFHTLRCMEPWPSLSFMLRARAHWPFVLNFRFFHCSTSSGASKPLRCRRWTFEASAITCQYVGYAEIRPPFRATVHSHVLILVLSNKQCLNT